MKIWVGMTAFLMLSGCANHPLDCATGLVAWDDCLPGTRGYEIRQESLKRLAISQQGQATTDDQQCRSYGAIPGSDAYVNCRVLLSTSKVQADAQIKYQQKTLLYEQLKNTSQNQKTVSPALPQVPIQKSISCTANQIGNTTYTNCH